MGVPVTTDPYESTPVEGGKEREEEEENIEEVKVEEEEGDYNNQEWDDQSWKDWTWEDNHDWYGASSRGSDEWEWDDSQTTVKAEPVGENSSSSSKGSKNWWGQSWESWDYKVKDDNDKSWHSKSNEWWGHTPAEQWYLDRCSDDV